MSSVLYWTLVALLTCVATLEAIREHRHYGDPNVHIVPNVDFRKQMRADWQNTTKYPEIYYSPSQDLYLCKLGAIVPVPQYGANNTHTRRAGVSLVRVPPRKYRKEYRQLTDNERTNLHEAFNELRIRMVPSGDENPDFSEMAAFVQKHRQVVSPAAHDGPAFLPFHREYLWRFERALQTVHPTVMLPYYDSTLDQLLPTPKDSAIWTDEFLGNKDGPVTTGFAANWQVVPNDCMSDSLGRELSRKNGQGKLLDDAAVNYIIDKNTWSYADITYGVDNTFENNHGSVHMFIGGHMSDLTCAPNDPVFWFHHTFLDSIWQTFRSRKQDLTARALDYPPTNIANHGWDQPMKPFEPLINVMGLSNHYTDYFYQYAPRPHDCTSDIQCGSKILFCDMKSPPRCTAKVKEGGNCTGLGNNACYCRGKNKPGCVRNKCQCI